MTTIEEALKLGFDSMLSVGGRPMSADTGETVLMLIDDAPDMTEQIDIPKSKMPIYVRLSCRYGSIAAPYTVKTFTEAGTGKIYDVLRHEVDPLGIDQKWICERQR